MCVCVCLYVRALHVVCVCVLSHVQIFDVVQFFFSSLFFFLRFLFLQFILNTGHNWYFGRDNTGNIMSAANISALWERCRSVLGPIQLVTGDGSINCQFDPNEQEMIVAQLHYCEAVFALGALAKGGDVVLKMFTLFEHASIGLMYLLGCVFDELIVSKPSCSKASNAEVYVVAKGKMMSVCDV